MSHNNILPGLGTHHASLHVSDLDASLRLYRDVLGMIVIARHEGPSGQLVLLDIGDGTHLELHAPFDHAPAGTGKTPWRHLALRVEDAHAAVEMVRAAGVPIRVETKDVQLGPLAATVAFFVGPDGEEVEFFQVRT